MEAYTREHDAVGGAGLRDYRPAPQDPEGSPRDWRATTLVCLIIVAAMALFAAGWGVRDVMTSLGGEPCVTLRVWPRVAIGTGSMSILVEARIRRHADHRKLVLEWDSDDSGGAGRSERDLDGDRAPVLQNWRLFDQPVGSYTFMATVYGEANRPTGLSVAKIQHAGGVS